MAPRTGRGCCERAPGGAESARPRTVADRPHQRQALLQAGEGRSQPALLAVHVTEIEEGEGLEAPRAEFPEPSQALLEQGGGVVEPALQAADFAKALQALQLPTPVALLAERRQALMQAGDGVVSPVPIPVEVAEAHKDATLGVAVAGPAGGGQPQRMGVLPVVPVSTQLEEAAQGVGEPPCRLPEAGMACLLHGGDQAGPLGLEPPQRVVLHGCRRGVVGAPAWGRVAGVALQAAGFQDGGGALGQGQVGAEQALQRCPSRPRWFFLLQAFAGKDAQQVMEAIAQLPGLVLPGCLH